MEAIWEGRLPRKYKYIWVFDVHIVCHSSAVGLEDMEPEEAFLILSEACSKGEYTSIRNWIAQEGYGDEDYLKDAALSAAIESNIVDYVEKYIDDIDEVNDVDGYSSYLTSIESERTEIRDMLIDRGAVYPVEYYEDYRFSYCTTTDMIHAFDSDFQREAFEKYLKSIGMSEEDYIKAVYGGDIGDNGDLGMLSYEDIMSALGIKIDEEVLLINMVYETCGCSTAEVLRQLGYSLTFEGDS